MLHRQQIVTINILLMANFQSFGIGRMVHNVIINGFLVDKYIGCLTAWQSVHQMLHLTSLDLIVWPNPGLPIIFQSILTVLDSKPWRIIAPLWDHKNFQILPIESSNVSHCWFVPCTWPTQCFRIHRRRLLASSNCWWCWYERCLRCFLFPISSPFPWRPP